MAPPYEENVLLDWRAPLTTPRRAKDILPEGMAAAGEVPRRANNVLPDGMVPLMANGSKKGGGVDRCPPYCVHEWGLKMGRTREKL